MGPGMFEDSSEAAPINQVARPSLRSGQTACAASLTIRGIDGDTDEHIARLDALGFNWTSQEYVTRSFGERIEDLRGVQADARSRQREDSRRQQPRSILCARQARTKNGREGWHEEADGRAHSEA